MDLDSSWAQVAPVMAVPAVCPVQPDSPHLTSGFNI